MSLACFFAVEGIDGCGKTGVVAALASHLRSRGLEGVATREPGGTPQGERIRSLILSGTDDAWDAHSELLLMTAARVEHVRRVISPALQRHEFVVSDRYIGSTIAYQGAGRGMSVDVIRDLHLMAVGDVWPDLTIVLDLDPEIGLSRSRRRLHAAAVDEGRFETLDLSFHRRIRESFLDQARTDPTDHAIVDASGTPQDVLAGVIAAIETWAESRSAASA